MKISLSDIEVSRAGKLKISSSGYSDRYLHSYDVETVLTVDGIKMKVGHEEAAMAILLLAGLEGSEAYETAIRYASAYDRLTLWATYESASGTRWGFNAASDRELGRALSAAMAQASLASCNELGVSNMGWALIHYSLLEINEKHAKTSKPVVDFYVHPELMEGAQ